MNLLQPRFDLSLFLVSRNRYRGGEVARVKHHITKNHRLYQPLCENAHCAENYEIKKYKRLMGRDPQPDRSQCHKRPLKISRELTVVRPWQLAPDRYGILKEPFVEKCGDRGAYWPKLPRYKVLSRKAPVKNNFKFYDRSDPFACPTHMCNKHAGFFLTNLRNKRASSRSMVADLSTCYRNPKFPGAADHYSRMHELSYKKKRIHTEKPNPHLFLRNSTVPSKWNSVHPKHVSFQPAPGRYENRYRLFCACNPKLTYTPGVEMQIEREKRLKFRRLPFERINVRHHCSGEWRHIVGHGYKHLFKNPTPIVEKSKVTKSKKKDTDTKPLQLYPDAKYINMINNPKHKPCSYRIEPLPVKPRPLQFNCLRKLTKRKQLKENKKIAFLSGMLRFKDIDPPKILSPEQLEEKIKALPAKLRIRHEPVMRKKAKDIHSLLHKCPEHMKYKAEVIQRRDMFKFAPLPPPMILVSRAEVEGRDLPFFGKGVDEADYFNDGAVIPPIEEILRNAEYASKFM